MVFKKMTVCMRLVPAMATLSLVIGGCAQNAYEANIPPEEKAQIAEITRLTPIMQDKRRIINRGVVLRGVHPKSHGCVAAKFTVNDELESGLRVGLFASSKTYDAVVRYSNAAVHIGDDLKADGKRENGSRGMAVKVYNVSGPVFIKDKEARNQDFLMINTPEFAFRNTRDYLRLTNALHESDHAANPSNYFKREYNLPNEPNARQGVIDGIEASLRVIKRPQGIESKTVRNPLQVQYFGAAPFLFGEGRAMKFSAKPCGQAETQGAFDKNELMMPTDHSDAMPFNYLRAALTETMTKSDEVCFDFMIQVRDLDDVKEQEIEDATTKWEGELDKYKPVAKIIIKVPQQPDTDEAKAQCEALAYTPWHSLKEHQPLGSINRLRRDVYDASIGRRF